MPSVWSRIDRGLSRIYSDFRHASEQDEPEVARSRAARSPAEVFVVLSYTGDLGAVERAGFKRFWDNGRGLATGSLRLDHLEQVAGLPEVIRISYGQPGIPTLDHSVPDIGADDVWTRTDGDFSGLTGRGVIVGIIDSGIDYRHDFFLKPGTSDTTRILRIWDQGLTPAGGEHFPDRGLLHPGTPITYGVEYTDAQINDVLRGVHGALPVRHRDCMGHGTHVAAIAAGSGASRFRYIGVAPEADLIVVKLLALEKEPQLQNMPLPFVLRFMDAVSYVLNVADSFTPPRPVVINYSIGSDLGPHDGYNLEDNFLTETFQPAASLGKLFVTSAGNAAGSEQHAFVDFQSAGTVEIPCTLYDERRKKRDWHHCEWRDSTKPLYIDCYYESGTATLAGAFRGEGETTFTPGPALDGPEVRKPFARSFYYLRHTVVENELPGGGTTRRNNFLVEISANPWRGYQTGTYTLRLTASGPLRVHLWCFQPPRHGFKFVTPAPAGVIVEDRFLIGQPGGSPNIITVGSFDAEKDDKPVVKHSSRGPLVQYGATPIPARKPDLCAPGFKIHAARSRDVRPLWPASVWPMNGTSMAAPHVAGTLALMLQKRPTMALIEAFASLIAGIRPRGDDEDVEALGAGRLDAKAAVDNMP